MKVLIVNTSDINGGAAIAANRLHQSLCKEGIECHMLVKNKVSNDPVVYIFDSFWHKPATYIESISRKFYKNRTQTLFSNALAPFTCIHKVINRLNPDIVHLNWVNGGMLRLEDLAKINAPLVWSLHDMWPFTGGCHYSEECESYKNKCGRCKVLGSNRTMDMSTFIHRRKGRSYCGISNMVIIGLSKWIYRCAKESSLFKETEVVNLPNVIDIEVYKRHNREKSRIKFGLPLDKKLILFGAMNATKDKRKGYHELKAALRVICTEDAELVVFGDQNIEILYSAGIRIHSLGTIIGNELMIALYSACDVMIVPSLQENLSNIILESMACETPVVAFDVGGNSEIIDHKYNGYLAKPFDIANLADGIDWILNHDESFRLRVEARKKIISEYSSLKVAKRYIKLYELVLQNQISN